MYYKKRPPFLKTPLFPNRLMHFGVEKGENKENEAEGSCYKTSAFEMKNTHTFGYELASF